MQPAQYQAFSPFDVPQPLSESLQDVTHTNLQQEISGCLKQKYLAPFQNHSNKASGILFGPFARPIVCLPVESLGVKGESLSVHFLVLTTSPSTYLSREALRALFGVSGQTLIPSTNVKIWETKIAICSQAGRWEGVNVLGADYLRSGNVTFECHYNEDPQKEFCSLKKKERNNSNS